MTKSSMPSWRGRCPTPKSASAPISSWIRRTDSIPCARKSRTFWPQALRCRSGEPDSPHPAHTRLMREIVLDTETTGLDPLRGDRLVEVGCVELFNRMPTGQTFHRYIESRTGNVGGGFRGPRALDRVPRGQAVLPRGRRRFPGVHRRRAAGDPQRVVRHQLHQCRARPHQAAGHSARAAGRHAAARAAQASRACRTGSTISARAMRSTILTAPSMAPCSTPSFSPKSMST